MQGALVAALAFPLLLTTACHSRADLEQQTGFAKQLDSQLYLRADGQKELRREVQYWAGSRNLKKVTVFFSAGGKQISVYRADGSIRLLTEWYPEPALTVAPPPEPAPTPAVFSGSQVGISPGIQTSGTTSTPAPAAAPSPTAAGKPGTTGNTTVVAPVESAQSAKDAQSTAGTAKIYDPPAKFGKVKRSIEYGDDGKTVVKASFFREDGSLSAYGRSLPGSDFALDDYLKDGRTLARQQVFQKDGDLFFMRVVVGAPSNTVETTLPDNRTQTSTFGADGIRVSRSTKPQYGDSEDVEFFKTDGKSLKYIVYRGWKIEALYFKADGTVDYFRSFDSDGSMTITKYRDNAGKVRPVSVDGASPSEAYRQYWQAKKDAKNNVTYEFTKLEEIGADGHVARRLTFSAGKLTRVEYLRADGAFLKIVTIRSDQTVEKIETYTYPPNGGETVIDSKDVAPGAAMRESYDGKLLERAPFEDVRPLVGPPATPSWYGYEGYGY